MRIPIRPRPVALLGDIATVIDAAGYPGADTVGMEKIDDYTVETVSQKGDKLLITTTSVVSKDGKSRTTTQNGTNAKDEKVDNTLVYDKQ